MAFPQWSGRMLQRCLLPAVVILSLSSFLLFAILSSMKHSRTDELPELRKYEELERSKFDTNPKFLHHKSLRGNIQEIQRKINVNEQNRSVLTLQKNPQSKSSVDIGHDKQNSGSLGEKRPILNYNVHIFYYPWYKNENVDGKYAHWNHEFIPHWKDQTRSRKRQHVPPDDVGANFYPQLGPYSSSDPEVVDTHMKEISKSGAGVLAVSWYPPQYEKDTETPVDSLMMMLFDAAAKYQLKIAMHIEPYKDRNGDTLREVVKYVVDKYGNHSAFYRTEHHGRQLRQLPVFYVYDSYQIPETLWADALSKDGRVSLRGTKYDAVFLGLLVEHQHFNHLSNSGFDGFYTYFASNGFSYGSTWKLWPEISAEAQRRNLIFVPSIGPGYLDTRVRQWNGKNTKLRLNGRYYRNAFQSALGVRPPFLSITSFNEWHEGTQVEAAIPKIYKDYKYEDYKPNTPNFYMNLTRQFVQEYHKNMTQVIVHEHSEH